MLVTLYTDASYSQSRGSGWAVWLRSNRGRIVRYGECPPYVSSSHDAELSAIFAGVYLARSSWPDATRILVCSDCKGALDQIAAHLTRARHSSTARLLTKIDKLVAGSGVTLDCRWVKGHQNPSNGVGAWLNVRCDALSRLGREARAASKRTKGKVAKPAL
ncbi:MAG: ribonuclease H family protein [Myxococcales bacterium]|jgi:ribonuclease HI